MGVRIFYRVAPRHKLALVRAFQSQGEIVAVTPSVGPPAQSLGVKPVGEDILNAKPRKADDPVSNHCSDLYQQHSPNKNAQLHKNSQIRPN
jgi:hypothetical protein